MADMTAGRKNKAAKHGRSHHQDKIGLFKSPWFPYLLTAVTLTAVFLAIMICCRLYPFGDRAMVSSDGKNQYLNFYHYFRSVLLTENNIDYTFSNVLGEISEGCIPTIWQARFTSSLPCSPRVRSFWHCISSFI